MNPAAMTYREECEHLRAKVVELTEMFEEAKTSWEQANEGWFQADKKIAELEAKEQVLYDIHDALGIKWGDDPYKRIAELEAKLEERKSTNAGWRAYENQRELYDKLYADFKALEAEKSEYLRVAALNIAHRVRNEPVEPVAWMYKNKNTDDWYLRWNPVTESCFQQKALYTQPPTTRAAVSAALRKAAEVCGNLPMCEVAKAAFDGVRSLPHDDSALRDICLRVAREVDYCSGQNLDELVDRVLGETK